MSPFQEIISNNFPISFHKENKGKSTEGLEVYINILCFSEDFQLFIRYLYVIFWNMSFQYHSSFMKKIEGEGGMFWKNSMYIIYSETNHQPRWDAWDKCSGLVHWEDPEGSGGVEGGRGVRDGENM